MTTITLYNTRTRKKEPFTPNNPKSVGMYVCGPTVYDRAHIGNARPVVVYDILYRLLRHVYGDKHVTYVRNITDVDDKINARAAERGINIRNLTEETTRFFYEDMGALHALPPDIEPRATEHIDDMIAMIEKLMASGYAYEAEGHVLFNVGAYEQYGALSGRNRDDMIAGARVEVAPYKKDPADFVLWKPSTKHDEEQAIPSSPGGRATRLNEPKANLAAVGGGQTITSEPSSCPSPNLPPGEEELISTPGWDSPWGYGRPGWHIECSAMSTRYLGTTFDIHGGGRDLIFPHHENEVAQSCCANPKSHFARFWVHNGFLTVDGEKMSKSLGNFFTVRDLLDEGIQGEVIRFVLLTTHYREPLDWNDSAIEQAKKALYRFYSALEDAEIIDTRPDMSIPEEVIESLCDDMNTSKVIALMHHMAKKIKRNETLALKHKQARTLQAIGQFLGILQMMPKEGMDATRVYSNPKGLPLEVGVGPSDETIDELISQRAAAKQAKNFTEADEIREKLAKQRIMLEDTPEGTKWRRR